MSVRLVSLAATAAALTGSWPLTRTSAPPAFVDFDAGGRQLCGLDHQGLVHCTADIRGTGAAYTTIRIPGTGGAKVISVGASHACALTHAGRAYCWGRGGYGQLGAGAREDSETPVEAKGPERFTQISAGGTHTCAVAVSGSVYCWGGNWHGQLGIGHFNSSTVPARVDSATVYSKVSAGGIHSCGIAGTSVKCWGDQRSGRLGLAYVPAREVVTPSVVAVDGVFADVSAGNWHTCGLLVNQRVMCWGGGETGAGADTVGTASDVGLVAVRKVAAGPRHTCAIDHQGGVWCWGANSSGEIGSAAPPTVGRPVRVPLPNRAITIATGGDDFAGYTCVLTEQGVPKCWGDNRRPRSGSVGARTVR